MTEASSQLRAFLKQLKKPGAHKRVLIQSKNRHYKVKGPKQNITSNFGYGILYILLGPFKRGNVRRVLHRMRPKYDSNYPVRI